MKFYPFHIGDYTLHTRHLSLMEDLAYRRLLDLYYTSEQPLPSDPERCAKLIGMRDQLQEVRSVLADFFQAEEDGHHNKRADEELAKFKAMADGGRRGASKRWAKGSDSPPIAPLSPPDSPPNANQEPRTKNQEPEANASVGAAKPRPSRKCPESFFVDDEMREWALRESPSVDIDRETAKFRDHTFKTALSDWRGAWRNWVRRAAEAPPRSAVVRPLNRQLAIEAENKRVAAEWLRSQES